MALGFVADGGFRPIRKPYKYSKRIIPGRIHTLWTSLARSVSLSLALSVPVFFASRSSLLEEERGAHERFVARRLLTR